jgi:hypothetical protein
MVVASWENQPVNFAWVAKSFNLLRFQWEDPLLPDKN